MSKHLRLSEEPYKFGDNHGINVQLATSEEWEDIRKSLKLRPEDNEPHKPYTIVKGGSNDENG